jgi:hypothetical protein
MRKDDPADPSHSPARRRALGCLAAWAGAAVVWKRSIALIKFSRSEDGVQAAGQ